jgi:hypothetical protein
MANTPSIHNTGAFSQLISRDFRKVAFDEYTRQDPEYEKWFNVSSMDGAYIREGQAAGLGAMQRVAENQPFPYDGFVQGNEKTIYPEDFALGLAISHDMYMDDQTGIMKKGASELGKSAAYTRELLAADMFNSGFVATVRAGIDGLALFHASHTLIGGGTYGNTATGASSALSLTSLQARMDAMELSVNEKNIPIKLQPKILLIPPQLRWIAERLTKSEFNPENANNEPNSALIRELQFSVCHFFTSTTNWFLLTAKEYHDLRFIWREKLSIQNGDDFDTGAALFKATMRAKVDFVNWRGIDGSAGA